MTGPVSGGRDVYVAHNNQYFYGTDGLGYAVEPHPPQREPDWPWLRAAPSRLLDARSEVVPFAGRDAELADLTEWRDVHGGPAARLLHATGGQGKTRLALRFARLSREAGWTVLTARYDAVQASELGEVTDDVLLVVDYADRWPHSRLVRLLADPVLGARRARVLLLGRSVQWWPAVRGELADLRVGADERRLGPPAGDRHFDVAAERFAQVLERPVPPAPAAGGDGTVLTVHMAALAAAYGGAPGPQRPEAVAAFLLDREHMTWRRQFDAGPPFRTRPQDMARLVFTATLTGAQPRLAALPALGATGLTDGQALLDDHRLCYPPTDPATVLEPLAPDRLAEDFLALSLPGHRIEGYDADPWASDAVAALLARTPDGAAPAWTPRAVTFLAAAAARWPHLASLCEGLLCSDPGLAVDAGGAGLAAVADIPDLSIEALDAVVAQFPQDRRVDLDSAMADLVDRRTRDLLATRTDGAARLAVEFDPEIPFRLLHAGRYAAAVELLERIVPLMRRALGLGSLSSALDMLASALLHCGRIGEALQITGENVERCRRADDGDALGLALVNHSTALGVAGDLPAALEASAEAVRLIAASTDDKAAIVLATAQANRLAHLVDAGLLREAVPVAETSIALWRSLAEGAAQSWSPELALTLNRAGLLWADLGDRARALAATEESAALYRSLAEANPDAFRSELAGTLSNLSRDLSAAGRSAEALDAARESTGLWRDLAARDPRAYRQWLATSLSTLASRYRETDRPTEAIAAAEEAIGILRRLGPTAPPAALASALMNLSGYLRRAGRSDEAVAAARDSAGHRRTRADATGLPGDRVNLACSLEGLALAHLHAGSAIAGAAAAAEAAAICEGIDTARAELAGALMTSSQCLDAAGQPGAALHAVERAVRLLVRLAGADPEQYRPDLADAFNNLSGSLAAVGRHAEAGSTARQAVILYRELAVRHPGRFGRRLANAHYNLTVALMPLGNPTHLINAGEEAIRDLRRLAGADPTFEPDLAMSLSKLSVPLAVEGRWDELLRVCDEAIALRRRLAAADPAEHRPHLARLLYATASMLLMCDVAVPKARHLRAEALALYRDLAARDPAAYGAEFNDVLRGRY